MHLTVGVKTNVIVSDLTYVNVAGKWHYICNLIDLYNREIVGFSVGKYKTAGLVKKAFDKSHIAFKKMLIFHTDRGKEFDNALIEGFIKQHSLIRSLSKKGNGDCELFFTHDLRLECFAMEEDCIPIRLFDENDEEYSFPKDVDVLYCK